MHVGAVSIDHFIFLLIFPLFCRKGLAMTVVYMLDVLRSFLIYRTQILLQHVDIISQFLSLSFIMSR